MKLKKITTVENGAVKRWYDDACGTALALELIGERWSLLVVRELLFGPRRFGEIRANLPGISANVLTQRLEGLEENGIVVRRKLPSPANVQVYELTPWGLETSELVQVLGRWATRSSRHDPMLYLSPASAMMSLRTMIDLAGAAGESMTIAFRFPGDGFVARIDDGAFDIVRGQDAAADVTFTGDTMAFRRTIFGKEGFDAPGLLGLAGDRAAGQRFVDLFALPIKIA